MDPKHYLKRRVSELTDKLTAFIEKDMDAIIERLSGKLNTIDILGHTFYVDIPMDRLRPEGDYLSEGIQFSKIEHYLSEDNRHYQIPYNPKTKEFEEVDYDQVQSLPSHLCVIELPNRETLDPIGYCRTTGIDIRMFETLPRFKKRFEANEIDWADSYVGLNIKETQRRKQHMASTKAPSASRTRKSQKKGIQR